MKTSTYKTTTNKTSVALSDFDIDEIGDEHLFTGLETPMRDDAFALSDQQKKEKIAALFEQIMHVMGLDLTDDSLKGTPKRVAKMYIDEIFSGLNPKTNRASRYSIINTNTDKCSSRKRLRFTRTVSTILYRSLARLMSLISLQEK